MTRLKFLFLLLAVAALSSCAPMMAVPSAAKFDAPLNVEDDSALLIRPGDMLKIIVYGDETLTGEFPVDAHDRVTFPLIGDVDAGGLSKTDLQSNIVAALNKKGFMKNASVTVDVMTMRPYYVLGEVKTPGNYPYQPSITALQAIASAGGYGPRAAHNLILIDRAVGDNKTIRLNARENTPLLPGDSIIVRERIF